MTTNDETPNEVKQLQPLVIDAEHKKWFIGVLSDFGFSHVASAIAADDSDEWFTRMFVGMVHSMAELAAFMQSVQQGALQRGPGGGPPGAGIQAVQQDRRIIGPTGEFM